MDATQEYMAAQTGPTVTQDESVIYHQLESFDWSDAEFQAGLKSILEPMRAAGRPADELADVEGRAKVFFFTSKTGHAISYDDYLSWRSSLERNSSSAQTPANSVSAGSANGVVASLPDSTISSLPPTQAHAQAQAQTQPQAPEPYPASFDAIVELISTGQTDRIPGIRDIPLKINESEPTSSRLPKRSKPWEREREREREGDAVPEAESN